MNLYSINSSYENVYSNSYNDAFNSFSNLSSSDDNSMISYDELFVETKINENIDSMALKGDFIRANNSCDNIDEVGRIFFSNDNLKRIQNMIKKEVGIRTNNVFKLDEEQDYNDLVIAMKAVYYEHNRFVPVEIVRQVKVLNRKLIDYIMPDIITQIKQSYSYIQEINKPLEPITRPLNVNSAGRKSLPALSSVWGI